MQRFAKPILAVLIMFFLVGVTQRPVGAQSGSEYGQIMKWLDLTTVTKLVSDSRSVRFKIIGGLLSGADYNIVFNRSSRVTSYEEVLRAVGLRSGRFTAVFEFYDGTNGSGSLLGRVTKTINVQNPLLDGGCKKGNGSLAPPDPEGGDLSVGGTPDFIEIITPAQPLVVGIPVDFIVEGRSFGNQLVALPYDSMVVTFEPTGAANFNPATGQIVANQAGNFTATASVVGRTSTEATFTATSGS